MRSPLQPRSVSFGESAAAAAGLVSAGSRRALQASFDLSLGFGGGGVGTGASSRRSSNADDLAQAADAALSLLPAGFSVGDGGVPVSEGMPLGLGLGAPLRARVTPVAVPLADSEDEDGSDVEPALALQGDDDEGAGHGDGAGQGGEEDDEAEQDTEALLEGESGDLLKAVMALTSE
jgi:hypothetical protein